MSTPILIIGLIETFLSIICFYFKRQEHFLLCILSYNILLLVQYLLQGSFVELAIILIDIIRNIVFYFYAKQNLKPNICLIIIFEDLLILFSIALWQNWFSCFMLMASLISTFASWQKNMLILRIGFIANSALLIINYAFTGLYTTIVAESVTFFSGLISIFFYNIKPSIKKF